MFSMGHVLEKAVARIQAEDFCVQVIISVLQLSSATLPRTLM
jgi:hypothetical protein